MEGLNLQSNKIIAASFDKNKNGFVEELNASEDVKKLLDKEGDGISVKELATGLAHDLVVVDGDSIKKGSLGKIPTLRETETLRSIDNILNTAMLQANLNTSSSSTQVEILKTALISARELSSNVDHSIYVVADNALMNANFNSSSSTASLELLKNASQSIVRMTSSVNLEKSVGAIDNAIAGAFSTVNKIEEKQKTGVPVKLVQNKLMEKSAEEKEKSHVVLKSTGYGAVIGALGVGGTTAVVRALQGTLLTPETTFIAIKSGVLRTKPLLIAAGIGLAVGATVGVITGAIKRSNHLDKAESYEKTANRIELYDPSLAGETVLDKAGELYKISQKAVKVESLLDAKFVEQSATKLGKEVKEIDETAKNILNAYKLADK